MSELLTPGRDICGIDQADFPTPEEIDAILAEEGLARYEHIPTEATEYAPDNTPKAFRIGELEDDDPLDEAASRFSVGNTIQLPTSATKMPSGWPPYGGAQSDRAWNARTLDTVQRIRRKVPGIVCATYAGHGRTGIWYGIDAMVSHFTQAANNAEEDAGDRLCNWVIRNWRVLNVNYVIYWNYMNDGNGWFSYEPLRRRWAGGSQNLVSSRHYDHLHIQVDSPYIAGNE